MPKAYSKWGVLLRADPQGHHQQQDSREVKRRERKDNGAAGIDSARPQDTPRVHQDDHKSSKRNSHGSQSRGQAIHQ
jgi:hypothetical protein